MKDIKSMNLDELKEVCVQMGKSHFMQNSFTAGSIRSWLLLIRR